MNYEHIEAVAAVLQESPALTEIELRSGEIGLRLRRAPARPKAPRAPVSTASPARAWDGGATGSAEVPATVPITAGVVGVFRALGGSATIGVGDPVKYGQVLGQIEAIRLLNDCVATAAGIIAAVVVQEGQPVEYGQLLFEIAPEGPS